MLFLVISTPRADPPSTMTANRQKFWEWIKPHKESGKLLSFHARVGRGAVALLNVDSNSTLHQFINEWAELIPGHHDIYPLMDGDEAQAYLKVHKAL